jgi:hypothetical protein
MSERRHQKKPLVYIADASFRYTIFGLCVYLVYFVATDQAKMQFREGMLHIGLVVSMCIAVGVAISSLTWWAMKKTDGNDDQAN